MVEDGRDKDGPGFVRRWSERKSAERQAKAAPAAPEPETGPEAETRPSVPAQSDDKPALPPVESLGPESDYTPFLDSGVPLETHKAALRKLWRSDERLANLDGLNDYDEDFTRVDLGKVVKTAYRIGKGFVDTAAKESEPAPDVVTAETDEKEDARDQVVDADPAVEQSAPTKPSKNQT